MNVWKLNPDHFNILKGDAVRELLKQLGIPSLFSGASEFDAMHAFVAFDNQSSDRDDGIAESRAQGGKPDMKLSNRPSVTFPRMLMRMVCFSLGSHKCLDEVRN